MTETTPSKFISDTPERRNDRIRRVITHLKDGTTDSYDEISTISATEYTDPALAVAEREFVFGAVPSIVAHGSEIPTPGKFVTVEMPRNKIIVVRQKDGSVKAFVNACRHRGAMLETAKSGHCRIFSCPYHRWSYDTDGSLRTITRGDTFGDLDQTDLSLAEIPCEERHGFVWVIDRVGATIDVAGWLGEEMDTILASYDMDRYTCFRAGSFTEPVNWKLMQDAFLDGYHIQYAHPNTAGKYIHTNVSVLEDFGRHCRWIKPRKSIDRWIDEDPADRPMDKYLIETHFLGPNSTLLKQPDHIELLTFRPHPTDPGQSIFEMRVIPPKVEDTDLDEEKWTALWEKNWDILLRVLHAEDFPIMRGIQAAMQSGDVAPMYLGKNELANQIFRRELFALLEKDSQ
ncbi:aromatic ring-hydroxylating dioxygenase subunit alpha [Rhodococcus olei]|uniref:Aromatic ring-hydroxylating dioxygenase subunit alpha n=1 Tax=Rhodococcus olei TaxID=2161675 RepID=A0ABP8NYR4_9NOCA